ncbi:anti-sigma factor family protein [Marinobacter sp.]|uniref:anti-sigma factor family protein n=1 Tax=Marinobacter sp. TaxID=50741 RepID=UPI0035651F08
MTSCQQSHELIDQYVTGAIAPADALALERHLAGCPPCARRLRWHQRITDELANQAPVPEPSADFEARVLAAATGRVNPHARRRWLAPVAGSAVAAALVLGLALGAGIWTGAPGTPEQASSDEWVVPPVPREQTVKLAFTSGSELDNVSLTLELPAHVELARFPGHQTLTWQVDLKPGDNVIALPLRIAYPEAGEIIARLDDGRNTRTFRAAIPGIGKSEESERGPSS